VLANAPIPSELAGSHLDILPTLIDLAAPAGFVYHAFGRDLFDGSQSQVGFGCEAVISPHFVFKIQDPERVEDLHGNPVSGIDAKALSKRYRQLHALGWWRATQGKQWPDERAGVEHKPAIATSIAR
jgi:hypothetical protein